MSGREFDPDGTDSYHPEHPWEQPGHGLYIDPGQRAKSNWPPEPAFPAGPHEAMKWDALPDFPPKIHGSWYREYGRRTCARPIAPRCPLLDRCRTTTARRSCGGSD